MGLRGPGAARLKAAREALPTRKRRLPWQKKGLDRAERMLAFIRWLPVTKGSKAGKRMRLLPGQERFVRDVYGALQKDGRRKVRIAVKSEPRGNGKTGLVAALCLGHLLGPESEQRNEIYSAGIDRQQAGLLFAEMAAVIERVPEFAIRCNIVKFHKRIEVLSGPGEGSIYEALSADARRAHGLAPGLWIFDELAQTPNAELLENLRTAMGKRRESLGIVISTQAATDDHALSRLIDDGLTGIDPSIHVDLTCAPEDADVFDPAVLKACNPAWGVFLDGATILSEADPARRIPAFESRFRNLRCNQRAEARTDERLCTAAVWRLGGQPVDRASLRGRTAYAGLDLSAKGDLTALVLAFPDDARDPSYDLLPFFWTPRDALATRTATEQDRFRDWIRGGHLIEVPGPVIKYSFVAAELTRLAEEFDIAVVGFDRWRIEQFKADLFDVDPGFDVPLQEFGQGFQSMGPAIDYFSELALSGRLRHGSHPLLTACVAGAITVPDPAGNLKVEKGKSNRMGPVRVDGAVAMLMALGTAHGFEAAPKIDVNDFLSNAVFA
ncbi:terminase large subunit [Jiella sp. M17.18]|uniref:terminase large subunit n=1 Tax=Jiella sp. M17.18 TaxID=3234247 RepID=UPI0034DEC8DC